MLQSNLTRKSPTVPVGTGRRVCEMHTITNSLAIKVQDLQNGRTMLNATICPEAEYGYIIEDIADSYVRLHDEQAKGKEAAMVVYLEVVAEGKVLQSMIGRKDKGLKIRQTGIDIVNEIIDAVEELTSHSISGQTDKYIPDVFYACAF